MEELVINRKIAHPEADHEVGLKILVGSDVFDILKEEVFLEAWDRLCEICPWSNVFFRSAFSKCWYKIFESEYIPILVKAEKNGVLKGLLPLSVEKEAFLKDKYFRIKGAGFHYFEYQGWLAEESQGTTFIQEALELVLRTFPTAEIMLQYMPAGIPVGWVKEKGWAKRTALQQFGRPLMAMDHPDLPQILKKRSFKTKLNRLKRQGKVEFREVVEQEEFENMLPELAMQFDFRQGAMFNKNHFQEHPGKAEFLKSLFAHGYLHTTVLQLDGEVIASLVAVIGENWLHLGGINTHSPHHSVHSPGFVHFIMLGKQLLGKPDLVFDLTPGGDEYKERLATGRDVVYGLTISQNTLAINKKKARVKIDDYIVSQGKRPVSVENDIKKQIHILTHLVKNFTNGGAKKLLNFIRKEKPEACKVDVKSLPITEKFDIRKGSIEDLLQYHHHGQPDTRWEMLIHFMKGFERMEEVYTVVEDGELKCCAWVATGKAIEKNDHLSEYASPEEVVLNNFYCHPSFKNQFAGFLRQVIAWVRLENEAPIKMVYDREFKFLEEFVCP